MENGNIDIGDQKLSYLKQGSGSKTIVLIHGNSCCKEVFAQQFEHFKDTVFSLLAFDLPGHGESGNAANPKADYTIPGYGKIIGQALTALGIENYILVGWSLGGNIALEMAGWDLSGSNSELKAIVILGAPPVGPGLENMKKGYLPAVFDSAASEDAASEDQIDSFVQIVYGTLDPIPKKFYQCAHRADGKGRENVFEHWMSASDLISQYETASQWAKPICVIHGNLDPFIALDYLKGVAWSNLWHGKIFEMPKSGHAPFIEDPKTFNIVLEEFATDVL